MEVRVGSASRNEAWVGRSWIESSLEHKYRSFGDSECQILYFLNIFLDFFCDSQGLLNREMTWNLHSFIQNTCILMSIFKCHPSARAENFQWIYFCAPFSKCFPIPDNTVRGDKVWWWKIAAKPTLGQSAENGEETQRRRSKIL